jgi:hypothetical protein
MTIVLWILIAWCALAISFLAGAAWCGLYRKDHRP